MVRVVMIALNVKYKFEDENKFHTEKFTEHLSTIKAIYNI